jgi:hypothetical protein
MYEGLLEEVGGLAVGCGEVAGLEVGMRVGGTGAVDFVEEEGLVPCPELVEGLVYPTAREPLIVPPPPEFVEPCRQLVCTLQLSQSKVMVPKMFWATVCPWKTPLASIVTPRKLIQPVEAPHA